MGVTLSAGNGKDYFDFNWANWRSVLSLALDHGWEPSGTRHPAWVNEDGTPFQLWVDPEEWDGTYVSNNGQFVTREDARNLADALEMAINDMFEYEKCISYASVLITSLSKRLNDGSSSIKHEKHLTIEERAKVAGFLEQKINNLPEDQKWIPDVYVRVVPTCQWKATSKKAVDIIKLVDESYVVDVGQYELTVEDNYSLFYVIDRILKDALKDRENITFPSILSLYLCPVGNANLARWKKHLRGFIHFCRATNGFYIN